MKKLNIILIASTLLLGASLAQAEAYRNHLHNWNNAKTNAAAASQASDTHSVKTADKKDDKKDKDKGATVSTSMGVCFKGCDW